MAHDTPDAACRTRLRKLVEIFGDDAHLALTPRRCPRDRLRLHQLAGLAAEAGAATVVAKVQREGDAVHIVATRLHDGSGLLASVGDRDGAFPLHHGRGDVVRGGGGPDARGAPPRAPKARDIYIPDLSLEAIKVRTRDFR